MKKTVLSLLTIIIIIPAFIFPAFGGNTVTITICGYIPQTIEMPQNIEPLPQLSSLEFQEQKLSQDNAMLSEEITPEGEIVLMQTIVAK